MRNVLLALTLCAVIIPSVSAEANTEESLGNYKALMQKVSKIFSANAKPEKCRAEVIVLLDDATTTTDKALSCNVGIAIGMYNAEECDWAIETASRLSSNATGLRNNGVKLN